jgi:hypothetical protein
VCLARLKDGHMVCRPTTGALQRQPSLFDDLLPIERIAASERLLDDDPDTAADRQQMQKTCAGLACRATSDRLIGRHDPQKWRKPCKPPRA